MQHLDHSLAKSLVRIRATNGSIIGAGFLVKPGLICTCAHVVADALEIDRGVRSRPQGEIQVDFPFFNRTKVVTYIDLWHPIEADGSGDIAVLRIDKSVPSGAQPVRLLINARLRGRHFEVCGFPIGNDAGAWAQGEFSYRRSDGSIQIEDTKVTGYRIQAGFSGGPVWDVNANGVVGMIVAAERDSSTKVAFLIPNDLIQIACPTLEFERSSNYAYAPSIPFQVPPLPTEFVLRVEDTWNLKTWLLNDLPTDPGVLSRRAIHGLGGIGKTTIVASLAHDPDVQQRFPDGVLWNTLGQHPDVLSLLSTWIRELGDVNFQPTSIDAASGHLRTLLHGKSMLLILDDVWSPDKIGSFLVATSYCKMLITTREANVARILGADIYELDVMTSNQAINLLERRLHRNISETEAKKALDLAKVVGYLPLALALAAAQIDDGVSWDELLVDLKAEIARLQILEFPDIESFGENERRYLSLRASFALSLRNLSEENQRRFARLGILSEGASIYRSMAGTLWDISTTQASITLRTLRDKALLLTIDRVMDHEVSYRLHNMIHSTARILLTAPLETINASDSIGFGISLEEAHAELLKNYSKGRSLRTWHNLPDDGYIHANLTWHMERCQQIEAIHQLLSEETSDKKNGWYQAREKIGQIAGFLRDIERAWHNSELIRTKSTDPKILNLAIGRECRYAILKASVRNLAGNMSPNLLEDLVEHNIWTPTQALAYSHQIIDDRRLSKSLIALSFYLSEGLLEEALIIAEAIEGEASRLEAMLSLTRRLPRSSSFLHNTLRKMLEQIQTITSGEYQVLILGVLAPELPDELLDTALYMTKSIRGEEFRADALATIIRYLPVKSMHSALLLARELKNPTCHGGALVSMMPYLPSNLMGEVLRQTSTFRDKDIQASMLASLFPYLPADLKPQAMKLVESLPEELRLDVLDKILPFSPKTKKSNRRMLLQLRRKVAMGLPKTEIGPPKQDSTKLLTNEQSEPSRKASLHMALLESQQIKDGSSQLEAQAFLARYLSPKWQAEIIEIVRSMQGEVQYKEALDSAYPYLPTSYFTERLREASSIPEESKCSAVLATFALHLPLDLVKPLLVLIRSFKNEENKTTVLLSLIPRLPANFLGDVLSEVRAIRDEDSRTALLTILISYLPDQLLGKVLASTQTIKSLVNRLRTQAKLSGRLSGIQQYDIQRTILKELGDIKNTHAQSDLLIILAPFLQSPLVLEALKVTRIMPNDDHQKAVRVSLLLRLPNALLRDAISITKDIKAEKIRSSTLELLVPNMPHSLFAEAISMARSIKSVDARAIIFTTIFQHFPQQQHMNRAYHDL